MYHVVRESLRSGNYSERAPEGGFPQQALDKAGVRGYARLVPATHNEPHLLPPDQHNQMLEQMWALQARMSDLDADNLDALNYRWLIQARSLKDSAITSVDDLLRMRNLKPNQNGASRRGGYKEKQRIETLSSCARLQSLFLNITLEPVKEWTKKVAAVRTRVITITDLYGQMRLLDRYLDVQKFIHQPGETFGRFLYEARHVALLSVKALSYDPYRQLWEKRLTRHLTWIWKIRAPKRSYLQPHKVETLLGTIGQKIDPDHPRRSFERLKKALETLRADGVTGYWNIEWAPGQTLCDAMVTIEPPQVVQEFYSKTIDADATQLAASKKALEPTLGELVKIRRQELGLTQAAVAKEIPTATGNLSQLENGGRVSESMRARLEEWLSEHQRPTQSL